MKDRKEKETKIKSIDNKIQYLKSEIDKNRDVLSALEDHKKFLITISPPSWVQEQEMFKLKKREKIKKTWIDWHKKNRDDDNLIFRDDDDLYTQGI